MNTQKLSKLFANYDQLVKIAKQLHHQDENSCNYGLTPRQEKRVERLEKEADKIAKSMGLYAYHQSHPRGGSLYLTENRKADSDYYNGVFIA
jgi:hypothetical protein